MRALFDHQIFSAQAAGGISRYCVELIRAFEAGGGATVEVPVRFSNNDYLPELRPVRRFLKDRPFRGRDRLLEWINRGASLRALREGAFDLFHPTFYSGYFLGSWRKKPLVITVHDMIHDLHPELPAHDWEVREKGRLLAAADRIIVPSQAVAGQLRELRGIGGERVRVVHHGIAQLPATAMDEAVSETEFLYVGGRGYYKNFDLALRALARRPAYRLCCVGAPWSPAERSRMAGLGLTDRVRLCAAASDRELAGAYRRAVALVFPSREEGFGLPTLEAFAAGCPALLADTPVFREVGGAAARYFDANDPEALAAAMDEVSAHRAEWAAAGRRRAAEFSWERCAAATLEVYREAVAAAGGANS